VGHHADEHLEAIDFLLNQELFKYKSESNQQSHEQRNKQPLSGELQQKLQHPESNQVSSLVEIRLDSQRERRKRVPEIIFGETKDVRQLVTMTRKMLANTGRAIISRVQPEALELLREVFKTYRMRVRESARAVVIYAPDYVHRSTGGQE
jgi:NCAIR mutase (PurE)-related protein